MTAAVLEPDAGTPAPVPTPRDRLVVPMPTDRLLGWLLPLAVTAVALWMRLHRLGSPQGVIFDEQYYAKDALDQLRNGVSPAVPGTAEGFVVHPPLGKWLIALGEAVYGVTPSQVVPLKDGGVAGGEVGFRVAAAVAGALSVLVLIRAVRRMTRSTLLGCVAGLLLALDALHFVQSRVAMLDIFLLLFVVVAFGCLVADRDDGRRRLAERLEAEPGHAWPGPRLGVRPWRLAAAVAMGCALAVKWSAVYPVAVLVLLAFAWEVGARRTAGVDAPVRAVLRREVVPFVAVFAALPLLVYVASWTGWFVTDSGWRRVAAEGYSDPDAVGAVRGFVAYHLEVLRFHSGLSTPHPYASHPGSWLVLGRPVAYSYESPPGCGADACSQEVLGIGTPAVWWASIPALLAVLWRWVSRRDWRAAATLAMAAASLLPWFAVLDRTMFLFYALPALPFLVLALTLCAGQALGPADATPRRRQWGTVAVGAYLLLVVANFLWLHPVLSGELITYEAWRDRMWFASWI